MARLTGDFLRRAQVLVERYPDSRSALLPLLYLAQEQDGHLTNDAMAHIGELLSLSSAEVLGTASFYTMFKRERTGKYLVSVCTNLTCLIEGASEVMHHVEQSLGVKPGQTTADGLFTLEHAECLAACGGAPCLQVNYRFFEKVTPESFDRLVDDLRAGRLSGDVPVHGVINRVREAR